MFNKIAVAIDGSTYSVKALQAALALSKEQKAQLHLLHVVKEIRPQFAVGEIALSVSELNEVLRREGENLLDKAKAEVESSSVPCRTHLIIGDPAEEIIGFAKEYKMDLIVIGSRGLGTVKGWMLGSVSHKVCQLAECPVLVVK